MTPLVIAVEGVSGVGKSTLMSYLASRPGCCTSPELHGSSAAQAFAPHLTLFADHVAHARALRSASTSAVALMDRSALSSLAVAHVCDRPAFRAMLDTLAAGCGDGLLDGVIVLDADERLCVERRQRQGRDLGHYWNNAALLRELRCFYSRVADLYPSRVVTLDASRGPSNVSEAAVDALAHLADMASNTRPIDLHEMRAWSAEPKKRLVIAIEPHPDDVALSCFALLCELKSRGYLVEVHTLFSETSRLSASDRFATMSQRDYLTARRSENRAALEGHGGFAWFDHGLRSATLRGYSSPWAEPASDDPCRKAVEALFETIRLRQPFLTLAPTGIGGHTDHRLLAERFLAHRPWRGQVLYEDLPYALKGHSQSFHGLPTRWEDRWIPVKQLAIGEFKSQAGVSEFAAAGLTAWRLRGRLEGYRWLDHTPSTLEGWAACDPHECPA